jgi:hypothetical protein
MSRDANTAEPFMLKPALRWLISLLVTLHLAGVFSAALWQSIFVAYDIFPMPQRERMYGALPERPPMAADGLPADAIRIPVTPQAGDAEVVGPPAAGDPPPDVRPLLLRWMGPYLDQLFMGGGYNFFSPDPGACLIIRYVVDMPDGSQVRGQIPDLDTQWPRLRYHRYFMISSQANRFRPEANNGHPIALYLLKKHGGRRVRLDLLVHFLLTPEEVIAGKDPNGADQYQMITPYELNAGEAEQMPEEVLPPGVRQ